eukprot:CAMPEP_0204877394 /NCGR_PEP_ID=MMETSP1348-20121228/48166_1 /ASSEMBLY_ACC=CAM_ASM_000700 /TAXON_ID=215587 /ORGANISM="Aplanochytrium stocchinoi, Strain GSBS06" /LENGTH=419 /DNA_ID=CAMNT_0052034251 /DNA_START=947 /DNA_END=2206 /DNA_ORIENTATION=-
MKVESDQESSSSGSAAVSPSLDKDENWETIRKLENLDLYEITFANNVKKTVGFDAMAELVNQGSLRESMTAESQPSSFRSTNSTKIETRPLDKPGAKITQAEYESTKMEMSSSEARSSDLLPTTVSAVVKTVDPGEKARTFGRSSSKYFGVSWHSQRKRWRAYIYLSPGRQKYLGTFEDQVEAALAYDKAVKEHHLRSPLNFGVNLASKAPKQKKRQLSVFKEAALKLQEQTVSSIGKSTQDVFSNRNQAAEWLHIANQSQVIQNQLQCTGNLSGSKKPKVHIQGHPELSIGAGFPNVYLNPQPSSTQPVSPIRYGQPNLSNPSPFSLSPSQNISACSTNHIPPFIQYQNQQQQQFSTAYQMQKPVSPPSTYNRPLWTTGAATQLEHQRQQQIFLESFRKQQQQQEEQQQQQQRYQRGK